MMVATPPKPTASPAPSMGGDLMSLLSVNGVPIDSLNLGGAGSSGMDSDEDSWDIYKGPKEVRMEGRGYFQPPNQDDTDTVGNFKKDLFRKHPGELSSLQRRLWEAGFYDQSTNWDDVRQNDYDEDTQTAWRRAIKRAAGFYDAGKKLTVDEVIDMARMNMTDEEKKSGKRSGGSGGRTQAPLDVVLTHPDDIKTIAMKASAQTLGRGWSEDQLNRFVATYQSMERASQTQAYNAQGAGGTSTRPADIENAVAVEARRQNPTAAGATDYVNAYKMILTAFQTLGAGAGG